MSVSVSSGGVTRGAQPRSRISPGVVMDAVLAVGCGLLLFWLLFRVGSPVRPGYLHAPLWFPPILAVCLSVPVALRRRVPLFALVVVLVGCVATLALGGELTRGPFVPVGLVLYVVALTCRSRVSMPALAAGLLLMGLQALVLHFDGEGPGDAFAAALTLVMFWVVGTAMQQRRAYARRLREQAATSAVTAERLRIARELHDVVAHSMTVVAVQAGFGEYVFDSQPTEAKAALSAIQDVTRDALADMQQLLGVLRQADPGAAPPPARAVGEVAGPAGPVAEDGLPADRAGQADRSEERPGESDCSEERPGEERPSPAAPLAPAPGLDGLERLAASTAGAGIRVEIRRIGRVRSIPAGIDLSAFRIVQEALTNVVKHSGARSCVVTADYGAGRLSVSVTDPGPAGGSPPAPDTRPAPPSASVCPTSGGLADPADRRAPGGRVAGTGHGLLGMAERVSLCGGQLSAGPLPTGGFGVWAHLPIPGTGPP